jgi:hypothetical protein
MFRSCSHEEALKDRPLLYPAAGSFSFCGGGAVSGTGWTSGRPEGAIWAEDLEMVSW